MDFIWVPSAYRIHRFDAGARRAASTAAAMPVQGPSASCSPAATKRLPMSAAGCYRVDVVPLLVLDDVGGELCRHGPVMCRQK